MKFTAIIIGLVVVSAVAQEQDIDLKHLRCLVCRKSMNELEGEVKKINPNIEVNVGNYRMDAQGNTIQKKVPLSRSEVHISDMLDSICEKMNDYARARYKSNGQLTILGLMTPSGALNPLMSEVDIIQDGDLNKSLKYYCEGIVEEFEDDIVNLVVQGETGLHAKLCADVANMCNDTMFFDDEGDEVEEDTRNEEKYEL